MIQSAMSILALSAALGASFSWAAGAMIAHRPARLLGAFEFTRTQLVSASALLLLIVTAFNGWPSVSWKHWPNFAVSSLVGVVLGNLAMVACLRRGGPRRTQLLAAMSAPFAAALGYVVLGETIAPRILAGSAVALAGIGLAIFYGRSEGAGPDRTVGPPISIIVLGLASAACQAIGLVALKPALLAGTEPLAASALRTGGGALVITLVALWPANVFEPIARRTGALVLWAILPGLLGYVVAVSFLLYALRTNDAGVVAVLGSAAPVMMLPMIWLTTKRCPPWQAWIGACLVVAGVGVVATG